MILIALGSNLASHAGPPRETLMAALKAMEGSGIDPVRVSQFVASEAWPNPDDPKFVNAVAHVETAVSPLTLLERLHGIERSFGRQRTARNAPRTLDLDIIDYDGRIESGPPQLPHPRMQDRAFVLVPLAELAPDWRHPISGRTAEELLAALQNTNGVLPIAENLVRK